MDDAETDNPYYRFGKRVHRKYLGFGTMGSAFFARNMITDALVQAANEDRSARSLSRLKKAVAKHRRAPYSLTSAWDPADTFITTREGDTIQYRLMASAALKTMSEFPDIRNDFTRVDNGVRDASKELTHKLKQVCRTIPQLLYAHTPWRMAHICWYTAHTLPIL